MGVAEGLRSQGGLHGGGDVWSLQGTPVRQRGRARDPRENRGGVWEGSHVLDAAPAIPSPTPHGAAGAARVRGPTPQSSLEAAKRRRLSKSELSPSGRVSDVRGHPPSKISVVLRAPYLERRVSASQAARRTAEQKARLNSEALKCEKKTSVSGWMRFGTGNGACDTRPHAGRDSPFAWLCRARHRGPSHLSLLSRGGSGLCGTGALWGERSRGLFSSSPRFSGEPRGITNFSGLEAAAGTS